MIRALEGCKIGALVCDCVDGGVVDSIEEALKGTGASLALIAPAADRVLTAEGDLLPAQDSLRGHPEGDYDAVILLLSPAGAKALAHQPSAVDFVNDVHDHDKPIAFFPDASPLVTRCGLDEDPDGVVEIGGAAQWKRFIRACEHRLTEREPA